MLSTLFERCLAADYKKTPHGGDYAMERDGDTLYIFLEHSDGEEDWRSNLDLHVQSYPAGGYAVHRGFLRVWEAMMPDIQENTRDLTIERIVTVGYSHGAALAVLCHEYLWRTRPDLRDALEGYGFASPRVVWGHTKKRVLLRWSRFAVIRIPDDLVTHLPPRFSGYHHVGRMIELCEKGKYSAIDAHRAENLFMEMKNAHPV